MSEKVVRNIFPIQLAHPASVCNHYNLRDILTTQCFFSLILINTIIIGKVCRFRISDLKFHTSKTKLVTVSLSKACEKIVYTIFHFPSIILL